MAKFIYLEEDGLLVNLELVTDMKKKIVEAFGDRQKEITEISYSGDTSRVVKTPHEEIKKLIMGKE